jgi:hypothetical protein
LLRVGQADALGCGSARARGSPLGRQRCPAALDPQRHRLRPLGERRIDAQARGLERRLHALGAGPAGAVPEQRAQVLDAQLGGAALGGRGGHLASQYQRALDVLDARRRFSLTLAAGFAHVSWSARAGDHRRDAHGEIFPVRPPIHSRNARVPSR